MPVRKLLLFDIDGTLLRSRGASREAKSLAMLEVFGTDANIKEHPFGGKTDWQILCEVLEPLGFSKAEIGREMPRYQRVFAREMARVIGNYEVTALPGAHDLIAHLRQQEDIMLGLVTGNTEETAPVKLIAGGFAPDWFTVGAYGSESDNRNDLPRFAMERAHAHSGHPIAPQDVMVIGDTVMDVLCARAVGAVAVTVFTGFEERDAIIESQPDYMLEDLRDFLSNVPL